MAEIERLRCVVTVARAGGISAAARALGVSRPTVSRAVADVERAVGIRQCRGHGGTFEFLFHCVIMYLFCYERF